MVEGCQVIVPLKGAVDLQGELARLDKELAKLDKDLICVQTKLHNESFVSRAPAQVVGETVIEDGVAVTEKETQGGDVGGVAAHIGDAVLDTVEVGQGALELAMGRTFAAHQAV